MLSERQKKIVELVLKYPTGINAALLSKEVHVSSRTVRNDIASINICLMNNHCMINSSKRIGYFIVRDSIERVKECISLMDAIHQKQIATSPMERKYYILGQLIQKQRLNLYDVAAELYVSEQTIYKDFVSFQKLLKEKFHFEQIFLENGELVLYNNEDEIRSLFYRIVKEEIYVSSKLVDIQLYQLVMHLMDIEELYDVVDYISGYCKSQGQIIPDQMLFMISWMLLFTVTRVEKKYHIKHKVALQHKNEELQKMLHMVMVDLHYECGVEDITLLQNYIETLGLFSNQHSLVISDINEHIIKDFTKQMKMKYNLDFKSMPSLFENFKSHLEFAIKRLIMDYQLINPLLQEVKTKYAFAYEIAMLIVPIVYKQYALYMKEDELSFLALYIQPFLKVQNTSVNVMLVHGRVQSFTNFIETWLQQEFKERIRVVGYAPAYKLEEEIQSKNIDLIIANVALEKKLAIPVIQIVQLPLEYDRVQIENFISRRAMVSSSMTIFHKIFAKERILILDEDASFEEIIQLCANQLVQLKKIDQSDTFVEAVMEREQVYPTHIQHGCFMPHPLMNLANESAICLALVKGNVERDGVAVNMVFVSAFEPKIEEDLKYIYKLVNTIATNESMLSMLMDSQCPSEVIEYLENIIQIMKD